MAKKRGQQSGTNNGQNNDDDDDDDDGNNGGALSDSMRDEIGRMVNAAVSGQLGRKLRSTVQGAIEEAMAPLREQLSQRSGGRRRDDDDEHDDDDGDEGDDQRQAAPKGKRAGKAKQDPQVEAMQRRLNQLEQERKLEREQAITRERDATIREQLTKLGVDANRLRGAVAVVSSQIKRDEKSGTFSYVAKRDGYDDELDLDAGLKEWASTDEGKAYIAPQGNTQQRAGSGTRIQTGTPVLNGGRPAADPKAAKQQAKQQAMGKLSEAIGALGGSDIPLG